MRLSVDCLVCFVVMLMSLFVGMLVCVSLVRVVGFFGVYACWNLYMFCCCPLDVFVGRLLVHDVVVLLACVVVVLFGVRACCPFGVCVFLPR